MPKVSRNKISKEFEEEIIRSFFRALGKLRDAEAALFLSEFLTRSEKVMLAKRFMAGFFINQGFDSIMICKILKISKSTVYSVEKELLRSSGGYAKAIQNHKKSLQFKHFMEKLESILSLLNLPVRGSPSSFKRWKRSMASL